MYLTEQSYIGIMFAANITGICPYSCLFCLQLHLETLCI